MNSKTKREEKSENGKIRRKTKEDDVNKKLRLQQIISISTGIKKGYVDIILGARLDENRTMVH
jgi:hypothetical protein